jgi:hypothetical protein
LQTNGKWKRTHRAWFWGLCQCRRHRNGVRYCVNNPTWNVTFVN